MDDYSVNRIILGWDNMFVDKRLVEELSYYSLGKVNNENIEDYLTEKDSFYTFTEAKEDMECDTLEDVLDDFYLIVDNNDVMKFVGDDIFNEWVM